jgi:hypothetical protein
MPKLTLDVEALAVESFSPESVMMILPATPTTTRTREPGCTTPELCGTTVMA